MPRRTSKQRAQLEQINDERLKLTLKHAFRLRPHILRWQAEGPDRCLDRRRSKFPQELSHGEK
jgi:hypothetical protein